MKLFYLLVFFASLLFAGLNAENLTANQAIEIRLRSLPLEERESLTRFFRRLFYHGDFAYTLLGRKPMGSVDYNTNLLAFPQFYKEPEKHLFLMASDRQAWEIWERHKHLFPMKRYRFIKVEHGAFFGILLINTEKVYAIIEEHLSLFQELVGKKHHARKILELLCDGQFGYCHSNTPRLLTYYEALGLLYGYGKENVRAFKKRAQLSQTLRNLPIKIETLPAKVMNCIAMEDSSTTGFKSQPENDLKITTLATELNVLLENSKFIQGKSTPFLPLQKSVFWGNEQLDQTRAVIENYDELNEAILNIYESDKFLETILTMLTS